MTWILFMLCLAIAGRELYLAFDRKRSGVAAEIAGVHARLSALQSTREELEKVRAVERDQAERIERLGSAQEEQAASLERADARIRSLIGQINDRVLPEVSARLARQRGAVDRLSAEVARLRGHLAERLDQAAAASLGADPVDTVAGGLGAGTAEPRAELAREFARFARRYGLRVELNVPVPAASAPAPAGEDADGDAPAGDGNTAWRRRCYLSGRSPRGLERDFIGLLSTLRTAGDVGGDPAAATLVDRGVGGDGGEIGAGEGVDGEAAEAVRAARALLDALKQTESGGAQIGPLILARTPESLVCGVLPLAELRGADPAALVADPDGTAERLRRLPEGRRYDASAG
ncbi:hypothetical protein GCM10023085_41590 [Actinomadura viridis]|uniref:Coiled-coil protein SlyX n=1 Tax=Actinomadura viridis TaxID=58110 RepID=A0A931DJX7_9ACTN|nr:hypothetical protein [Actinomadura viridis]MBG6092564.1 putative coiled-coil protein SlyX [Actinomadura viridis]